MAQMPRGEPRSVPDPLAGPYTEMIRQDSARRQRSDKSSATSTTSLAAVAAEIFPPFQGRLDLLNQPPRPSETITIGGRTYSEVDNGRANVLVPSSDPKGSPGELADRRQAIARALFMAEHPLGSVAYALSSLANASPGVRDGALIVGGFADTAMTGAAPLGRPTPNRAKPTVRGVDSPTLAQPSVRYGKLDSAGRSTGVMATITPSMLGKTNRIRWNPPGWVPGMKLARGHIYAGSLGGSADPEHSNGMTITHNPTNSPHMQTFEGWVASKVRAGEIMEYLARPLYGPGAIPPKSILLTAFGSRGTKAARLIENPAGR